MSYALVQLIEQWQMGTTEGEGIMGYAELHTAEGWVNVEDIPMIETVICQLCNEPTEAQDITITARIEAGVVVAGTWSCNKCRAVNG
jgi:hypothetical protein